MPPPANAQFDRRLAAIFQSEAAGHVQRMQACIAALERNAGTPQAVEQLFRTTHSMKGAARAVGRVDIESVCHALETLLASLQRGTLAWSQPLVDLLHDTAAGLQQALAAAEPFSRVLATLLPRLEALDRPQSTPVPGSAPARPAEGPGAPPRPAVPLAADTHAWPRLGAGSLGSLLDQVEGLLAVQLGGREHAQALDQALAACSPAAGPAEAAHAARLRALRASALRNDRQLAAAVDTLMSTVKQALLVPMGSLAPFLQATVRELARSEGKEVELRLQGEGVELDRSLLQALREPLLHLLRNAIAHGIEPAAARAAAGKSARATLLVELHPLAGGRVSLTVADDGAGIDTARLAEVLRAQGLAVPEAATAQDLLPLMAGAAVSTAARLSRVAGRGLGMGIVQATVERLGGTLGVASTAGQGTRFTLLLPASLATFRTIEVRAGGRPWLVPTTHVERCVRVPVHDLRQAAGRPAVALGDESLALVGLAQVLGLEPAALRARLDCVILAGERRVALAVDAIVGEQEVLSKPLDPLLATRPVLAGAGVLHGGRTVPILNVAELVRTGLQQTGGLPMAAPAAVQASRSILVVEDSITSRTLLRNILELAGHRVDVAVDGADGLQRLRGGHYDLVVSDIEMPRLDGFGLTAAIRADPALARLPVVLVTSLAAPGDRERGAEAGANAYIVKSSFDQGDLLQAIEELA